MFHNPEKGAAHSRITIIWLPPILQTSPSLQVQSVSFHLRFRDRYFWDKKAFHLACPYGGSLGWPTNFRLEKSVHARVQSMLPLPATCTSNVLVHASEQYGMVVDPGA